MYKNWQFQLYLEEVLISYARLDPGWNVHPSLWNQVKVHVETCQWIHPMSWASLLVLHELDKSQPRCTRHVPCIHMWAWYTLVMIPLYLPVINTISILFIQCKSLAIHCSCLFIVALSTFTSSVTFTLLFKRNSLYWKQIGPMPLVLLWSMLYLTRIRQMSLALSVSFWASLFWVVFFVEVGSCCAWRRKEANLCFLHDSLCHWTVLRVTTLPRSLQSSCHEQ